MNHIQETKVRVRTRHHLALALLVFGLIMPACGAGPKPKELEELEAIWSDPASREVKDIPGAKGYYEDAYDLRLRARQAYNDGDTEMAREYAIWSILKYRTAESFKKQFEAQDRLEASNQKIRTITPELERLNEERNKLQQEVARLENDLRVAKRRSEDASARKNAMTSGNGGDEEVDDTAMRKMIQDKLDEARKARSEAMEVKADKFAASDFNKAENNVKSVERLLSNSTMKASQNMLTTVQEAVRYYTKSEAAAKPDYERWKLKQNPTLRNANMLKEAQSSLGNDFAISEGNGNRIILASLFDAKKSEFAMGTDAVLNVLYKLAREYDEYDLIIQGYTSKKGNATTNLSVSQNRAFSVRDFLAGKGIKKARMSTKGFGEDSPRFKDAARNDRVEVIFRHQ